MKRIVILLLFVFSLSNIILGQSSGNINYQNQVRYSSNNIDVDFTANSTVLAGVKGLVNVKADSYVAIFSVTQVGKTTKEVNQLIDARINKAINQVKSKLNVKTFIDMISFVPVYEYEVEKKIFSKNTYNEIPAGFELKKNIHIEYTDPNLLNEVISELSSVEIYDLVRVDYFSTKLASIKKDLRKKAITLLQEKLKDYQLLLSKKLDSLEKTIVDGFKVVLPVERYNSYQSYQSFGNSLLSQSSGLKNYSKTIKHADKSTTLFYQPIVDKEFDFVINPVILEPVIQVIYEIKLKAKKMDKKKADKKVILITPNGTLKNLDIK